MMFALIIYWFNYTIKNIAFDDSFYQTGIVGSAGEVKLQAVKTVAVDIYQFILSGV